MIISAPRRVRSTPAVLALVAALALALVGCGGSDEPPGVIARTAAAPEMAAQPFGGRRVLLISLDGFNPRSVKLLGTKRTPNLHRLIREGAATLNARTEVERTLTMPNHTGMLTGRRVKAARGGHGVRFNNDPGTTVHDAAGHHVASVFDVVHDAGGSTALYTSKEKFEFFRRSWPDAVDRFRLRLDNAVLVRRLIKQLDRRTFSMLHLSAADVAGHTRGFLSPAYLSTVERIDAMLGELLTRLDRNPELRDGLVVMITADHGGPKQHTSHSQRDLRANYRVPLIVWGDGVRAGDLYQLNPEFRNPGRDRVAYAGTQPIRNGMVANLATSLLGLPAVPGSNLDAAQELSVD